MPDDQPTVEVREGNELWKNRLSEMVRTKQPFCAFLVNGIKLSFTRITALDDTVFEGIGPDGGSQLVTFHAISTIVPNRADGGSKSRR